MRSWAASKVMKLDRVREVGERAGERESRRVGARERRRDDNRSNVVRKGG